LAVALCAAASPASARDLGDPGARRPPPESRPEPAPEHKLLIGILDVRVDGASEDLKLKFEQQLEQQLDTNQYWLASRASVRERMKFSTKWTAGCLVGACLTEVRTQTQAQLVLLAALTGSGTSFGYVVTLVRTDTGRVLAQKADRCDVCTANEVMTQATLATIELLNDVPSVLPDEDGAHAAAIERLVDDHERSLARNRRRLTRTGAALAITGLLVVAGGVAAYVALDHPTWGLGLAGGGAGLASGGVIVLSF
jgi:hypothetical protein